LFLFTSQHDFLHSFYCCCFFCLPNRVKLNDTKCANIKFFLDNNKVWIHLNIHHSCHFPIFCCCLTEFMSRENVFVQYFMNESLSTSLTLFIHFCSTEKKKSFCFHIKMKAQLIHNANWHFLCHSEIFSPVILSVT